MVRRLLTAATTLLVACAADPSPRLAHDREVPPLSAVGGAMVTIPPARFLMGSSDFEDSQPVHPIALVGFEIDATETTVAEYDACVRAGGCTPAPTVLDFPNLSADERTKWGTLCNGNRSDRRDHPINCIDWAAASTYCKWAQKRLPTEEEWEYAARGTDGRSFPWGNDAPGAQLCWSRPDQGTCPVASHPAGRSPFGVFDMAGNVAEWTATPYAKDYSSDPEGTVRVQRGGSFAFGMPAFVRADARVCGIPVVRDYTVGFRCAR